MAIGATSIIKDANGVNITVKDIATDYLVEQVDGTFKRENFKTDETMILSGFQEGRKDNDCWRKLPGGMLIQWGAFGAMANSAGVIDRTITLPVATTNVDSNYIDARLFTHSDSWNTAMVQAHAFQETKTQIIVVVSGGLKANMWYDVHWLCLSSGVV